MQNCTHGFIVGSCKDCATPEDAASFRKTQLAKRLAGFHLFPVSVENILAKLNSKVKDSTDGM